MKGINNKNAGDKVQFSKGANLTPFEKLLKRNQNSSALNINSPNLNPNDNMTSDIGLRMLAITL